MHMLRLFVSSQSNVAKLSLVAVLAMASTACTANPAEFEEEGDEVEQATDALVTTGNGIDTCGPQKNERCDKKIPVKVSDTKTILLGKYDITAGRFRTFVQATGGNIRGYIDANKPSWWNGQWAAALASGTGVGNNWSDVNGYAYNWSVWLPTSASDTSYALGPYNWGIRAGNMAQTGASGYSGRYGGAKPATDWNMYGPGNEGCGVDSFGARTYWQPNGTFGENNRYSQADLDKKALNCVSYYMLQAFCAWDGGRLPTTAELDASWGAETYPWGETVPYYANFNGTVVTNGPKDLANYGNSAGAVYTSPATVGNDMSNRISIPGSFPNGAGPYGHADVVGNVIAMTGDMTQGTANQNDLNSGTTVSVTNAPLAKWHRGGSWQGHTVGAAYTFIATNRYIAMGGRCAYDAGAPAPASFPMGFRAEYFTGTTLAPANSKGVRIDPYIAFNSTTFKNPAATTTNTAYSVRWTSTLVPRYTQTYTFKSVSGDGIRVWVNGVQVINDWTTHGVATKTGTIALTAGTSYSLKVEHYNAAGNGTSTKLMWSSSSQREQVIPASQLKPPSNIVAQQMPVEAPQQ